MKTMPLAGALLLLTASVAGAQAQPPSPPPQQTAPANTNETITRQVLLVNVPFTVTDKKGRMRLNLTQNDFRLSENGVPQKIQFFSREANLPLRIGVLIDTSNSVRERLHFEEEAAIDFLDSTLRPGQDKAFVVGFDVEPQLLQDYTDDTDKLSTAIRSLAAGGTTSLYDALYFACQKKFLTLPENGPYLRRVLIVVSDGHDNTSTHDRDEALKLAQESEAIIYTISTNNSGANVSTDDVHGNGGSGDNVLKYFSERTGGRAFFPFEANDLASNFQEIKNELRSQYSLAYVSTDSKHDGTFRRISLETVEKGLRVRAKEGYYAPSQ
jgi:VWFA-related protein